MSRGRCVSIGSSIGGRDLEDDGKCVEAEHRGMCGDGVVGSWYAITHDLRTIDPSIVSDPAHQGSRQGGVTIGWVVPRGWPVYGPGMLTPEPVAGATVPSDASSTIPPSVADDTLVFVREERGFRLAGGEGRGAGWADIVEVLEGEEPLIDRAWTSGTPVRIRRVAPVRIVGPYWSAAAAIVSSWLANIDASVARQKVSRRHSGRRRLAESPSSLSLARAAPGSLSRRFISQGTRLAARA